MKWANVGVGKLQRPYILRFFLLNAEGQPAFLADAKTDPRHWLPGEHNCTESLELPSTLKGGDYTLALALVVPDGQLRPFRLAMEAPEKEGQFEISK